MKFLSILLTALFASSLMAESKPLPVYDETENQRISETKASQKKPIKSELPKYEDVKEQKEKKEASSDKFKDKPNLSKEEAKKAAEASQEKLGSKKSALSKYDPSSKPKTKFYSLKGCEKEDNETINCPDGVYKKSSAISDSQFIKDIKEKISPKEKVKTSTAQ